MSSADADSSKRGIPEILVKGQRTLNVDIKRTADDVQPYVVFDREAIAKSGATSVEDFLKRRLTMNTVAATNLQGADVTGNASSFNLRGLGTEQTLVLVDGRRLSPFTRGGGLPTQPDLNGIPLSAIERIEVLPRRLREYMVAALRVAS
ncbi:MAG: Plug domain-containing protein [Gammaproteobacteria bacterium]